MSEKHYFIKPGYLINPRPSAYVDTEQDALTYQLDVYRYAADLALARATKNVLDVGCGFALKLREFLLPVCSEVVGIDGEDAISYCLQHHAFGRWWCDDIENPTLETEETFDLIISADVIEHLADPDRLLQYLRRFAHDQTIIVLSTPERDLRRGPDSNGPPPNPAHVREWNRDEFASYLQSRDFEILEHRIMELRAGMKTCQTVLARAR